MTDVLYKYISHFVLLRRPNMGFSLQESAIAFDKAAVKHPCMRHSKSENVQSNAERLWSKQKWSGREFGEFIRLVLNESCIWDKPERTAYASFIGYLYNPHAQAAKRYRKAAPKQKPSHIKLSPPPTIVVGPKGQLAWEI